MKAQTEGDPYYGSIAIFCWGLGEGASYDDGGATITQMRVYRSLSSGEETFLGSAEVWPYDSPWPGYYSVYSDTNFSVAGTYFYRVSWVNADGEGPLSAEVSASTKPGTPPGTPRNVVATTGPSRGMITLSWYSPTDTGSSPSWGIRIYAGDTPGGEYLVDYANYYCCPVAHYRDTGLPDGKVRYYRVRAYNRYGESALSPEVKSAAGVRPSAPRDLRALYSQAPVGVRLTWTAPQSSGGLAFTYRIYRGLTSGSGELIGTASGAYYTDTGCRVTTICYYSVSAVNAAGEGPHSNEAYAFGIGVG
jgi:hypothetical protein